MKTIYKYPIDFTTTELELPAYAKVLTCQLQFNRPVLWALVDTAQKETVKRTFEIIGTGWIIDDSRAMFYVSTFQTFDGLVFHVMEITD